jgi:glycosyltransferase involved in cell wall biosynthesis
MITTDVGGLAEIVPDGKVGFVVDPEVGAIREAILRFYREKKEDEFISNIFEEKKKYTWEKMVESINRLKETIKSGKDD